MNNRGFTLVELVIVVAIISLLAVLAIPGYIGQQKRAARTEAYTNLENLRLLQEQLFADSGNYATSQGVAGSTPAIRDANLGLIRGDDMPPPPVGVLPRFQPGPAANLNYSYRIEQNVDLAGAAQTPCFRATATGVNSTRVAGDSFMIDCNNNRNF